MSTPDLTQLRVQAKELLRAVRAGQPEALARALRYFPSDTDFRLSHAQLVLARENGYPSWAKLKHDIGGQSAPSINETYFKAIEANDPETVAEMLSAAPGLAASWRRNQWGWESALHVAAEKGALEVARLLVEAGAEVYELQQGGYPPVIEAVWNGHKELADYLLEESRKRDNGLPPTYGCGIDIVLASRVGWLDRIQMHVERDPFAVYRRGCIGETVLHWPAHNGYVQVVEYLLDHGAAIEADEIGLYGGKPLHWAAEHAPACVVLLLTRGADPNARNLMKGDFEGFTPLHMCARQREECTECARLLLDAGCDPGALDANGRRAIDVAKECGKTVMAGFLERVKST